MTDLISRDEVVGKLKKAYFDKNLQEAKNDPCVIDAMTDWAIRQVKNIPSYSPWHTGTPTEEGEYICWTVFPKDICINHEGSWKCKWKNGKWFDDQISDNLSMDSMGVEVIAWIPIEPYKEKNNG